VPRQIASQNFRYLCMLLCLCPTYFNLACNVFDGHGFMRSQPCHGRIFPNYDASFGTFAGNAEYAASIFMVRSALPSALCAIVNGTRWAPTVIRRCGVLDGRLLFLVGLIYLDPAVFPQPLEQFPARSIVQTSLHHFG